VVGVWERGKFEAATPDHVLSPTSVPVVIATPAQIDELNTLLVIYDTNYEPTVVIGGDKVGAAAAAHLKARDVAVHLVERDPALIAGLGEVADKVIAGDAADREVLGKAGLERAPAVILTTNDDSINIYLTVYCRRINPELRIISRLTAERNLDAIHRAGADFVLSYSSLGAEAVFSILQGRGMLMFGAGIELFHVPVPHGLAGKTLSECAIGAICGANVIAVEHAGAVVTGPGPETPIPAGGELLMLGTHEQRQHFMRAFN
jgi:Trk K+ transport system NAD-binding subunit